MREKNSGRNRYSNGKTSMRQTAYVHPEDFEHFAHHETIEREETEWEVKYQGISVEEAQAQRHPNPFDDPRALSETSEGRYTQEIRTTNPLRNCKTQPFVSVRQRQTVRPTASGV